MNSGDREASQAIDSLAEIFARSFENDDTQTLDSLLASTCEWVVMPTGETFRGRDEIQRMHEIVQAARTHDDQARITVVNCFHSADRICLEYNHRGIITGGFPSDGPSLKPGTIFEFDACATAEVADGKIVKVREYFDLLQFSTDSSSRKSYFD